MSWQADIKKLHEKSSSLGVDLTEFENELRDDEGWYTESNIQEFIECQNLQLSKQKAEIAEYRAFMLGLKLSSEDEARMIDMLSRYRKGE